MSWCKLRLLRRRFMTSPRRYCCNKPRVNEVNIQLLSENLHRQIFRQAGGSDVETEASDVGGQTSGQHMGIEGISRRTALGDKGARDRSRIEQHLKQHKLWDQKVKIESDVDFKLPTFYGKRCSQAKH